MVKDSMEEKTTDIFTDSTEELEKKDSERIEPVEGHLLDRADTLREDDLYNLTAKRKTRIIYILGPVGSGKTTFETMIYSCFSKNADDELYFSGSETLLGFENRLNHFRLKSGKNYPQMERTRFEEGHRYLQIYLAFKKDELLSMAFSDISGEIFERCISNRANMEEDFKNIGIAHDIVLFIDGDAVLDKARRQSAVDKIRSFLHTLKSTKMYRPKCHVSIVISKNDLIFDKLGGNEDNFIDRIDEKFRDMQDDYALDFYRIEALNGNEKRDMKNSITVFDLLKTWMQDNDGAGQNTLVDNKQAYNHDFNRFGEIG